MTFPSLFQTLPSLVIEMIIEYLLEHPRNSFDVNIEKHNAKKAVLIPLLRFRGPWREAALVSICDNCKITIDCNSLGFSVEFPAWPADYSYVGFCNNNLVKRVVVEIPRWDDMCSYERDGVFSIFWQTCAVFPSATTLAVYSKWLVPTSFWKQTHKARLIGDAFESMSRVTGFARALLKATPVVNSVITTFKPGTARNQGEVLLWNTLLTELCQGSVKSLQVYSVNNARIALSSMSISGLTRLIQQANLASAPFAELAYRNASTLMKLRVRTGTEANWRTLIYGGTSTPTVYSSFALFDLNIGNIRHNATWAPINKVVPFPALVRLEIREEYPFVDDLFLKDNDDTLISLHLPFCELIRNVLGRSGILNRSSISRLNSVTIGLAPDPSRVLAFNVPRDVIGKQVHRLLEMTTTLKLMNDPTGGQVHKALRTAPDTATLRHLEFIAKPLDVSQIIKVISALSSLVSLACQTLGIGARLESIPLHELPSTLHAKHYPLSNKFRKLQLSMATSVSVKPMTLVAMLIAIVCPNLSHVELHPQYRTVFWHAVTSAMARPDYKPYADTLRRLI